MQDERIEISGGVYEIINTVTAERYVGSSQHVEKRLADHILKLTLKRHRNALLQRAWDAYGAGSFAQAILFRSDEEAARLSREQAEIDAGAAYNISKKVGCIGRRLAPFTALHKARISKAKRGVKKSEEARKNYRAAALARFSDPEKKAAFMKAIAGRRIVFTTLRRAQVSQANRAKGMTTRAGEFGLTIKLNSRAAAESIQTRLEAEGYGVELLPIVGDKSPRALRNLFT